jgi:hypothetical protein
MNAYEENIDPIQKLKEVYELMKTLDGTNNIQIVLSALIGAVAGGLDYDLAKEVQKIVQEQLMPAIIKRKDILSNKIQVSNPLTNFDGKFNYSEN